MHVITNGRIVMEDRVLEGRDLIIEGDTIHAILPRGNHEAGLGAVTDARNGYVLPGFIDIHSDYIEHMAAPRPTSLMDFRLSLREAERELATHGITTTFHSLSLYNQPVFDTKPIRDPANTRRFIDLIDATHASRHLIRHRFHARFEIDNLARTEELAGYLRDGKVHLVSFMDHSPGQGQYRDLEVFRKTLLGYRDLTESQVDELIETTRNSAKLTLREIRALVELAESRGVAIASHDDDSVEKIALVMEFGATISEFPVTLETAREAKRRGMHTVAGAPNVLLGGSHSGNLGARTAILDGCVDILCSDYYPAAMLHAIFLLSREDGLGLPFLTRLVTLNPARAVRMDRELGSIETGKKADLLIVETVDGDFPVITSVFVDGRRILATGYRT